MWNIEIDMIAFCLAGMSILCLVLGCLFFVRNIPLWRTKNTLEMAVVANLDFPDEHDRIVTELAEIKSLRRTNKYLYIVFFTLSLVGYVLYTYWVKKSLPFDLLAFCISVVVTVPTTLFLSWFGHTWTFKTMRYSYYLEVLFGAVLALLWIATLFFYFYLFPWFGCLIAVLFIIFGLAVIWFINKYGNKK